MGGWKVAGELLKMGKKENGLTLCWMNEGGGYEGWKYEIQCDK